MLNSRSSGKSGKDSSGTPLDSFQCYAEYGIPLNKFNEIKELFKIYDKNGDGRISKRELMLTMQKIGANPTRAEVEGMIKEVDRDGNGYIEFKEFVQFAKQYVIKRNPQQELRDAFQVFDRNRDGHLDAHELKAVMSTIGERLTNEEVERMIREADINGDGKINIEEFVQMLSTGSL